MKKLTIVLLPFLAALVAPFILFSTTWYPKVGDHFVNDEPFCSRIGLPPVECVITSISGSVVTYDAHFHEMNKVGGLVESGRKTTIAATCYWMLDEGGEHSMYPAWVLAGAAASLLLAALLFSPAEPKNIWRTQFGTGGVA